MGGLAPWGVGSLCGANPSKATAHRAADTGKHTDLVIMEKSPGQAQVES